MGCYVVLWFALFCVATAVLKFFTKTTEETKKIKKRCFFASEEERRQSRFFGKKYYPRGVEIFFQKPEGLDLDGLGNQG